MSPAVQIKNAHSCKVCLQRQEQIRAGLDTTQIPSDLLQCIEKVICQYANLAFGYFAYLPYKEAKVQMKRVVQMYPQKEGYRCSKIRSRYNKLPFALFYIVEKGRIAYLQIKNK